MTRLRRLLVDGPKTRVAIWTDPQIKGVAEWMAQSGSADKQDFWESHTTISVAEIDLITPGLITKWLQGLGGSQGGAVPNMDFHFRIRVRRRTVHCRQRWVCQNGKWTAAERQANVTQDDMPEQSLDQTDITPSIQKVQAFLLAVRRHIDALKKAEQEADKAAAECT